MRLACHCVDPKDEVDIGQGVKGLLLLTLLGTAATGQELRIPVKGPFAWDKVEGQRIADLRQGPDETCHLHVERKMMMTLPFEGCCDAQLGNAGDVSI